jgi:hypothetical protein
MHLAVDAAAKEDDEDPDFTFRQAVDYLNDNHYLPKNTEAWAHRVREKGNEATHEIVMKTASQAEELIRVCVAMLAFMCEYAEEPGDAPEQPSG